MKTDQEIKDRLIEILEAEVESGETIEITRIQRQPRSNDCMVVIKGPTVFFPFGIKWLTVEGASSLAGMCVVFTTIKIKEMFKWAETSWSKKNT